ncbi:MAG: hypothetical protein ACOX6I_07840 [Syntrophomonadaceae bacterium]|jgi:hypothetical protein
MKLHIKSIVLAGILSACSILFFAAIGSANMIANNSIARDSLIGAGHMVAMASPTLIPPKDSGLTIHSPSLHKNGSVVFTGGFLFYSNNPETVYNDHLADNGCWLNQGLVSGRGQIYVWHQNGTNKTINADLLVTNPNSTSIMVKSNQYGLTNGMDVSDVRAWDTYLTSRQAGISIMVEPGQTVPLFNQAVAPSYNYGIVAAVNITDINGNPAQAFLEDIAYHQKISKVKFAGYDGTKRCRGIGSSYQSIITFDPVKITDRNFYAYSIGAREDSLDGKDLVKIKDGSNNKESLLEGNYGQVMTINLPIKNSYRSNQNFAVFIGSIGGYSFPLVELNKTSCIYVPVKPFSAYDMIQTGKINRGSTVTVSFTLVIPALSSTPLIIGVHPIN